MAREEARRKRKQIHEGIFLRGLLLRLALDPKFTLNHSLRRRVIFPPFGVICASAITGCAGGRPIASNPPTQPVSTPPSTEEEGKRSTSTEPQPKPSVMPPRRSKPADIPASGTYIEEGNA